MDISKIEEIESYNYNLSKYYGFTQNIIEWNLNHQIGMYQKLTIK